MNGGELPDAVARVRELERCALSRLPAMQLADGVFCEQVSAENGGRAEGRSLRSTICVLIGLLRAAEHGIGHPFHTGAMRTKLLNELGELGPGDLGLLLWAESRNDGAAAEEILDALDRALLKKSVLGALSGSELAWIAIGLAESEARDETDAGERILAGAREQLIGIRRTESGLLTQTARGPRRRFASFATQIHGVLALSLLARLRDDGDAREAGRALGDRLLELRRPDGGWPCVFDAQRGLVVEPYELYSVHQDALAPMGMDGLSEATGEERYRAAAVDGLEWIWGRNELEAPMIDSERGMIFRSIRRRERLEGAHLYGKEASAYLRRRPRERDARASLEIDRSDRPDHLGWILEAWSGKEELALLGA